MRVYETVECLSLSPSVRQTVPPDERRAAGLLSAGRRYRSICRLRRTAVNASNVMLTGELATLSADLFVMEFAVLTRSHGSARVL